MDEKRILLVDDDPAVLKLVDAALVKNGYLTVQTTSGELALEVLEREEVAAVILDVILPGIDGLETLKRIRGNGRYGQVPVLMLTCRDEEIDSVVGLELGADDYLAKPVRYHELIARLKNIFRRIQPPNPAHSTKINRNGLEIDCNARTVKTSAGVDLKLTFLEFEIFSLLADYPGKVFSRDDILDKIWTDETLYETRTVDSHIRRIRGKLREAGVSPEMIETVRYIGYKFTE
ncbi:MAG TPA: response regulator transcription factor [Bacillota bacterium]